MPGTACMKLRSILHNVHKINCHCLGLPTPASVSTSRVSNTTATITWEYPPPPFQPIQSFFVSMQYKTSFFQVKYWYDWRYYFQPWRWLTRVMLSGEVRVAICSSLRIPETSQWLVLLPRSLISFPAPTISSRSLPSQQMGGEGKCPALLWLEQAKKV